VTTVNTNPTKYRLWTHVFWKGKYRLWTQVLWKSSSSCSTSDKSRHKPGLYILSIGFWKFSDTAEVFVFHCVILWDRGMMLTRKLLNRCLQGSYRIDVYTEATESMLTRKLQNRYLQWSYRIDAYMEATEPMFPVAKLKSSTFYDPNHNPVLPSLV
jgi:hypothetical protein